MGDPWERSRATFCRGGVDRVHWQNAIFLLDYSSMNRQDSSWAGDYWKPLFMFICGGRVDNLLFEGMAGGGHGKCELIDLEDATCDHI